MWTEARLGKNKRNSVCSLENPSQCVGVSLILSTSDFTKPYYYFQNRSVDATAAAAGPTFDATAAVTGRTFDATAVTAG